MHGIESILQYTCIQHTVHLALGPGSYLEGAGDVVVPATLLDPGGLPDGPVGVLVQVAGQHGQQGDQVEDGEHGDADHELDQLLLVLLLQGDLHPHAVQRRDARQQQRHAHLDPVR